MSDDIQRDKHIGRRVDGKDSSRDNLDNYYECEHCGQSVFMGDLGEVAHHEKPNHEPIMDG